MKKEVAFFKDSRHDHWNAKDIIALYKSLGYTNKQIIEAMEKIKAEREQAQKKNESETK